MVAVQVGYLLQAVKIGACAAFVGLLLAHWVSDLNAATVAVGVLFLLLGTFT